MTYFDCFVVGSWLFTIGWFLVAIYKQNHHEKTDISRVSKASEVGPMRALAVPGQY
jgi:hypothetical protein